VTQQNAQTGNEWHITAHTSAGVLFFSIKIDY